jgi:hypothetical protein
MNPQWNDLAPEVLGDSYRDVSTALDMTEGGRAVTIRALAVII